MKYLLLAFLTVVASANLKTARVKQELDLEDFQKLRNEVFSKVNQTNGWDPKTTGALTMIREGTAIMELVERYKFMACRLKTGDQQEASQLQQVTGKALYHKAHDALVHDIQAAETLLPETKNDAQNSWSRIADIIEKNAQTLTRPSEETMAQLAIVQSNYHYWERTAESYVQLCQNKQNMELNLVIFTISISRQEKIPFPATQCDRANSFHTEAVQERKRMDTAAAKTTRMSLFWSKFRRFFRNLWQR